MGSMRVERLDHLGIVAGICREIGLAEYLDGRAGPSQQQVSVGTATMAMILNGLGFSNRRLGVAVLRHQAGGLPAGSGDHRRDAARRLPGADTGLAARP